MDYKSQADEIVQRLLPITRPLGWDVAIAHPTYTGIWTIHFFPKLDFYPEEPPIMWSGVMGFSTDEIVQRSLEVFLAG